MKTRLFDDFAVRKSEKEMLLLRALRDQTASHNEQAGDDGRVPLHEFDVRANCTNLLFSELRVSFW